MRVSLQYSENAGFFKRDYISAEDNWRNDYPDEDDYYSSADENDRDDIGTYVFLHRNLTL